MEIFDKRNLYFLNFWSRCTYKTKIKAKKKKKRVNGNVYCLLITAKYIFSTFNNNFQKMFPQICFCCLFLSKKSSLTDSLDYFTVGSDK